MSFENYLIENSFKTNLLPNKKAALNAAFISNPENYSLSWFSLAVNRMR